MPRLSQLILRKLETDQALAAQVQQIAVQQACRFAEYQFEPARYITEKLGWTPWRGDDAHPGQQEILDAYTLALRQQHERQAFEAGELLAEDLRFWASGLTVKNRLRIEAGHGVGKTKKVSGIVNHFIDCFAPSIIYTFAPTWKQVKNLLWKEIKSDREGKGLPGRVLETCEIRISANHFAQGSAASNAEGKGTERVQGQHGPYLLFVLDEAEGVADFVFDAIDSMASGGIVIVIMLANPRTRTSRFHKLKSQTNVQNFRISCITHPNVLQNRELVPGAVRREYVDTMLEKHCEVVDAHNADLHTFELPWKPGVVYQPNTEFLFRVLGIAPANSTDDTFVPVGRYEAATRRPAAIPNAPTKIRMGIDASRFGNDPGTLYIEVAEQVWREGQFYQQETTAYVQKAKAAALRLKAQYPSLVSLPYPRLTAAAALVLG